MRISDWSSDVCSSDLGTVMRSFSESAGKVTGTASVPLPMAIMRIFGINSKTIEVTCDAEMRLPNTDVMFVLDTTGSMASAISGDRSEEHTSELQSLMRISYAVFCLKKKTHN